MAASKFARHKSWLKALNESRELRDIAVTARKVRGGGVDIRYVAAIIAESGSNGIGCYVGTEVLAEIMGCDRKTIEHQRAKLIELGWFRITSRTGGKYKRSKVLEINVPDPWSTSAEVPVHEPVSEPEPQPDPWAADRNDWPGEAATVPVTGAGTGFDSSFDTEAEEQEFWEQRRQRRVARQAKQLQDTWQ